MSQQSTLVHLFHHRVSQSPDQAAIQIKVDGSFESSTWGQLAHEVRHTAAALRRAGIGAGDRVIQVAENGFDWIVCDLAIQMVRAVHVPVHTRLTGEQIHAQIVDSGAKCVLIGDNQQYRKLINHEMPFGTQLVAFCEPPRIGPASVRTIGQLRCQITEEDARQIEQEALQHLSPASIATILYTSGTTGNPKGVVLSQSNLVSNTLGTIQAFGLQPTELRVCFLPFSHIFARTCDLYTWIVRGSEIGLVESLDTILPDCMRLKPHTINGVPYFFQRVHRYLVEQGKENEPGSLKKILGGEILLCCSGGAALPDYLFDFYESQGVPLLQGYGMTESSPVIAVNTPLENHHKRGTVGKPIANVEVRIDNDGEIVVRGPNVMCGYWNQPDATKKVIRDGWLQTGDLGSIDNEGYLSITGRKKEIIVTAGGKNIAPGHLEELLTEDPLIAQALVIGEGRNYLTALIVPDPDNIKSLVRKLLVVPLSKRWVLDHRRIRAEYEKIIQDRLACVSHHEQVRAFYLMDRGFTFESGEMTPKLSLKRELIKENCTDEIETMYGTEKKQDSSWAHRLSRAFGVG